MVMLLLTLFKVNNCNKVVSKDGVNTIIIKINITNVDLSFTTDARKLTLLSGPTEPKRKCDGLKSLGHCLTWKMTPRISDRTDSYLAGNKTYKENQ